MSLKCAVELGIPNEQNVNKVNEGIYDNHLEARKIPTSKLLLTYHEERCCSFGSEM